MNRFAHCRDCDQRIQWVRRSQDDRWLPVEPVPVSTDCDQAAGAWVVVAGRTAYQPADLAEVLMVSRSIALPDAREAVRTDFPWHRKHTCPYDSKDTLT